MHRADPGARRAGGPGPHPRLPVAADQVTGPRHRHRRQLHGRHSAGSPREHGVEVVETVANTAEEGRCAQPGADPAAAGTPSAADVIARDGRRLDHRRPTSSRSGLRRMDDDPDLIAVGGLFSGEDGGRSPRPAATQRVHPLPADHRAPRGPGLRADRHRVRVPADTRCEQWPRLGASLIPGTPGKVYDTLAMTEDNELTLALKTLGAQDDVATAVPRHHRDHVDWSRPAAPAAAVAARRGGEHRGLRLHPRDRAVLGPAARARIRHDRAQRLPAPDDRSACWPRTAFRWSPFWIAIGCIFLLERLVTVWAAGWRGRALAAPVVIELGYALFLQSDVRDVAACRSPPAARRAGTTCRGRRWAPLPCRRWSGVRNGGGGGARCRPRCCSRCGSRRWALFVGVNTLVFAALSVLQMLPPVRRTLHRRGITPAG